VNELLINTGLFAIVSAVVFGSFPIWKSRTLSPDSIQRRVWWTCCAIASVAIALSQLPDWGRALFGFVCTILGMASIALMWTNFIKIDERVYTVFQGNRRPDRPPALHDDEQPL